MDIFSPTILDDALITGSNNASLLQVSSPSAASAFFISGSGNVGIGTVSPISTLSVAGGNININDGYSIGGNALGSYVPFLRYNNTGAGVPSSSFGHTTAYMTSLGGGVFGTNDLIFYAGGLTQSEIIRVVGSTGFVGIGETSPSAKLEIKGSGATSATTALRVENSSATSLLTILNDGTSAFNTSHLYVSSSGRVGIGTTTPQRELDVNGTIRVNSIRAGGGASNLSFLTDGSSAVTLNIGGAIIGTLYDTTPNFNEIRTSNNQNLSINARGSGSLFLQTVDTTRLTITGSNVGIGTTSPSAQLHISGSATTPLRIQNPATTLMQISSSVANSGSIVFFGTTPTAAGLDLEIQSNGAANGGQVRIAGNGTQWDFGSVSAVARNGTGNSEMFSATMTGTSTTLVQNPVRIQFNANQSSAGGGGYTVLRLNATHASTAGTGSKLLQTWEFGGVAQSVMDISGSLGIGTGSAPSARLFISGASNQALFEIDSPAVNNIIYVSGSGNVGIGTGTPTNTLQVVGGITATSLTASIISASSGITGSLFGTSSWAQSASNAINSQTASFLPAGTYSITSSWAINARTSSNIFPAITNNTSSYVLTATGDGIINGNSNLTFNGSDVTLGSSGGRINLPVNGYIFGGDAAILNGNHVLFPANPPAQPNDILAGTSSLLASSTQIQLRSTSEPSVVGGYNSGSIFFKTPSGSGMTYTNEGRLGIGVSNPTNTLQIQGNVSASSYTGSLFGTSSWAQSASNAINSQTASFLPVGTYQITSSWAQSASNAINSQTASFLPIGTYQITSSWAQSASQALTASFLNGAFLQNGNSFGTTAILGTNDNQNLQLETSGSVRMTISSSGNVGIGMTTPSFRLDVSGSARFGTGSVGFASGLGQIHAVDRTGAYITATQTTSSIVTFMGADGTLTGMVGTYSSHDFVIRSNNSDKITLSAGGQVGIQTSPSEWIHLASDPPGGKYLQIDALQASNAPPYTSPPSFIENIVGPGGDGAVLGLPDYWMEIKLGGTIVLIPCYLPA
jgi:hypothetical protein